MDFFNTNIPMLSRLKENCPVEVFRKLNLPRYTFPKPHSLIPEKPNFQDYSSLLNHWIMKAFLYRYDNVTISTSHPLVIFTYVIEGGLGDWATQMEVAKIIESKLPNLPFHLIALVAESEKGGFFHPNCHVIRYQNHNKISLPREVLKLLKSASLILQTPTFYPAFNELTALLKNECVEKMPEIVTIGEYGFIDSPHFHPRSGALCMGLHTLEKGLLLTPSHSKIAIKPNQYLAYLFTKRGYAIYLHALLELLKTNSNDIHLYVCNPLRLLQALEEENFTTYSLKEIVILDDPHSSKLKLTESGKTLYIHCKQSLDSQKVLELLNSSENFVGCRGDRSFSEAICAKKLFYYDGPDHARPFLYDLVSIAKTYLFAYPLLEDYLRALLDKTSPPKELGNQIGKLLADPSMVMGMDKLITLLSEEFTFNNSLIHLIKEKISHFHSEEKKDADLKNLKAFINGEIPFKKLLTKV